MKFKYNFLERKLWQIEEDCFYEVSEENRLIKDFYYHEISFKLGKNHWLTFNPRDGWNYRITISYIKLLKNGEIAYYEKQIKRELYGSVETIIEFTETDRVEKKPTTA